MKLYSKRCKQLIVSICTIISLFACATAIDPLDSLSAAQLYTQAHNNLIQQHWAGAIDAYKVLESKYPYGQYAQVAMLELAYCYYNSDDSDLALPEIALFLRTYPTHKQVDYAFYLRGYINYYHENGFLAQLSKQDISERDPQSLQEAYNAFAQLIQFYPNSRYAADARVKMNYLINALARGELFRARHYMQINAYLAAINRTTILINTYPNTQYVEEALAMQLVAYDMLHQTTLSQQVRQIIVLNFPRSNYLTTSWQVHDMPWYSFWQD